MTPYSLPPNSPPPPPPHKPDTLESLIRDLSVTPKSSKKRAGGNGFLNSFLSQFFIEKAHRMESVDYFANYIPGAVIGAITMFLLNFILRTKTGAKGLEDLANVKIGEHSIPFTKALATLYKDDAFTSQNQTAYLFPQQDGSGHVLRYFLNDKDQVSRVERSAAPTTLQEAKKLKKDRWTRFAEVDYRNGALNKVVYYDYDIGGITPTKTVSYASTYPEVRYHGPHPTVETYRPVKNETQQGYILQKVTHLNATGDKPLLTETYDLGLNELKEMVAKSKTIESHDVQPAKRGLASLLEGFRFVKKEATDLTHKTVLPVEKTTVLKHLGGEVAEHLPAATDFLKHVIAENQLGIGRFLNWKGWALGVLIGSLWGVNAAFEDAKEKHTMVNLSLNAGKSDE